MVIEIIIGLACSTASMFAHAKVLSSCQTDVERESADKARHGWPIPKEQPPPDPMPRVGGWGTDIDIEAERWTRG